MTPDCESAVTNMPMMQSFEVMSGLFDIHSLCISNKHQYLWVCKTRFPCSREVEFCKLCLEQLVYIYCVGPEWEMLVLTKPEVLRTA